MSVPTIGSVTSAHMLITLRLLLTGAVLVLTPSAGHAHYFKPLCKTDVIMH